MLNVKTSFVEKKLKALLYKNRMVCTLLKRILVASGNPNDAMDLEALQERCEWPVPLEHTA